MVASTVESIVDKMLADFFPDEYAKEMTSQPYIDNHKCCEALALIVRSHEESVKRVLNATIGLDGSQERKNTYDNAIREHKRWLAALDGALDGLTSSEALIDRSGLFECLDYKMRNIYVFLRTIAIKLGRMKACKPLYRYPKLQSVDELSSIGLTEENKVGYNIIGWDIELCKTYHEIHSRLRGDLMDAVTGVTKLPYSDARKNPLRRALMEVLNDCYVPDIYRRYCDADGYNTFIVKEFVMSGC